MLIQERLITPRGTVISRVVESESIVDRIVELDRQGWQIVSISDVTSSVEEGEDGTDE